MSEDSRKKCSAFFNLNIVTFHPYQPPPHRVDIVYTMEMTGSTCPNVFKFGPDNKITITPPKRPTEIELVFRLMTVDYIFVGFSFEIPVVPYNVDLPKLTIDMEGTKPNRHCTLRLSSSETLGQSSYDYLMLIQQYTSRGYVVGIVDPNIEVKPN